MFFQRRRAPIPPTISMRGFYTRRLLVVLGVVIPLLGLALLSDCTAGRPLGGDQARYHDRSFRVVYVVDGDTLDINIPDRDKDVTRIRLWGVDTPEVARGNRTGMHFGAEASAFAKKTLKGQDVHIVLSPEKTRGKYGRLLAYVFLKRGGAMFNEMLIEKGYAYADYRFKHHYKKRFEAIEKRAMKKKIGLWADVTLDGMPPWKQRFENARTKSRE